MRVLPRTHQISRSSTTPVFISLLALITSNACVQTRDEQALPDIPLAEDMGDDSADARDSSSDATDTSDATDATADTHADGEMDHNWDIDGTEDIPDAFSAAGRIKTLRIASTAQFVLSRSRRRRFQRTHCSRDLRQATM